VDGFRDSQGVLHLPGDVIDLPAAGYEGVTWLESLEEKHKVVAAPSKVEPAPETEPVPEKKPRKKA